MRVQGIIIHQLLTANQQKHGPQGPFVLDQWPLHHQQHPKTSLPAGHIRSPLKHRNPLGCGICERDMGQEENEKLWGNTEKQANAIVTTITTPEHL